MNFNRLKRNFFYISRHRLFMILLCLVLIQIVLLWLLFNASVIVRRREKIKSIKTKNNNSLFNDKFTWTLADVHGQIKFQKYAQSILLFLTK